MKKFSKDGVTIYNADVRDLYSEWDRPIAIISDGGYGISGFPGDPPTAEELKNWYEPHIKEWSKKSDPITTLWFWNREIGWAEVHPLLKKNWKHISCNIWDKGIQHVAGNCNTKKLRRFPQVTELCAHYTKKNRISVDDEELELKEWIRREWERTDLPLSKANEACDVADAATRKYLTKGHLWYFPPPEKFAKMVEYANEHGDPKGKPYFSIGGNEPLTEEEWSKMRAKFDLEAGVTNVWEHPPLHGKERIKNGTEVVHLNQKPLELMERIIRASTDEDDVVWEPFGGLCSGAVASHKLGRRCLAAEKDPNLFKHAVKRLKTYDEQSTRNDETG